MSTGRLHLSGLLAVLLALIAQLGAGAATPQIDPVLGAGVLCHTDDNGNPPTHAPSHPVDCPLCPLCAIAHAHPALLTPPAPTVPLTSALAILRPELPPPATAPPAPHRPPSQPRAPPILS
ncbi:MAG TPA: DUF2946 family protein [Rhodopila sp.]|jgi:hypothetical protein